MNQNITEASGQVVTVHKGWTNRKKADDVNSGKSMRQKQLPNSSARLSSSSSDEPDPSSSSGSSLPKRPTPPVGPRQFEFVHGTDPFRNRDPDVRKLVRAHAMRDSARRKKKQQQDTESEEPEETIYPGIEFLEEAKRRVQLPSFVDNVNNRAFGWTPDPSLSLLSIKLDPYMTDLVHDLATASSRMYPRESIFKFNPISPTHWFHFALADKALLHAVVYTVFAYSGLFEGAVESSKATTEFSQCIALVNKRLAGPRLNITDGTVAAVSCLALVEAVKGNEGAWNMHLNGVKRMLELRGGFSELPKTLQMKLVRADLAGAIDFIANTHFPFIRSQEPSVYIALSLPELDIADDHLSGLLMSYNLDKRLIAVFMKLTRFSRAVDFALTRTSAPMEPLAFVADTFEIQSELLSIPAPELYESDELCLREALRMGALVFMKEILQEYPLASPGSTNLIQRMKNALSFVSDNKKYTPLLLWLLFMGGISSKKSIDRVWFMAHLVKILPKHTTWEDVRRVLKKVLWVEKLQGDPCRGLWDEVEITRAIYINPKGVYELKQ